MYSAEVVWGGKRARDKQLCSLPPPPHLKSQIFSLLTQPSPHHHHQRRMILRPKSLSFAEPDPVHGNWSEWTPYTGCSEACGGFKTRSRNCTNPAPAFNGTRCLGHSSEDVKCRNNCSGQCNYHSVFFLFFFFFFFFLFHIVLNLIFPAWKIKLNIKLEKSEKS